MTTPEMREIDAKADEIRKQIRELFELAENCKEITLEQLRQLLLILDLRIAQNDIINLTATWGM